MLEAMAKEIHLATDLSSYSHDELRRADLWMKDYALRAIGRQLLDVPPSVRQYVLLMVRAHYGSMETDTFLRKMGCYPDWLNHDRKD